jgi:hypothetical protein
LHRGQGARLALACAPSQCRFDLFLEVFVAQGEVAVGGIAYLPDDLFIEVGFEQGAVGFASSPAEAIYRSTLFPPCNFFLWDNESKGASGSLAPFQLLRSAS